MCDEEAETREHFVLRCRSLAGARVANSQVVSWVQSPPQHLDFDFLILASPRGAEDDIEKAILVGKLFPWLVEALDQHLGAQTSHRTPSQ